MMPASDAKLIDGLTSVVSQAASVVLAARGGLLNPRMKADQSPVTAADEASQAVILGGLARLLPGVPVISEEDAGPADRRTLGADFLLVDPLDGTRELLAGRDEFTINVALVHVDLPAIGIIAAPALGLIWRTIAGGGAERLRLAPGAPAEAAVERIPIQTRRPGTPGIVATVSRSHMDPATECFLAQIPHATRLVCGSAIKFCRVAEGAADIYPRLAPTYQWDVAAGHAVLAAAGGAVTTPQRSPLLYRPQTEGLLVPGFIAWGNPDAAVPAIR
jgi:3'(2'), 5'-bisphosphate nucleotidase